MLLAIPVKRGDQATVQVQKAQRRGCEARVQRRMWHRMRDAAMIAAPDLTLVRSGEKEA